MGFRDLIYLFFRLLIFLDFWWILFMLLYDLIICLILDVDFFLDKVVFWKYMFSKDMICLVGFV